MQLDRGDDTWHGTTVQPKLDRVILYALIDHCLQYTVVHYPASCLLLQVSSDSHEGGTGEEEGLHCALVGGVGAPAIWKRAETLPVPRCPMTRQSFHSISSREKMCLRQSFLHLPWRGAT